MLAVIYALRKFRSYLLCRNFRLYSDHESLAKFQKQPDLKKRDWRWAELLSEYTYEHYYRPGPTMFVPDAISRAFMGPHAHPTGVLAAIEAEAPFSGANDLWVTPDVGATVVLPDYTPGSGKAITYGVATSVVTVSAIVTRKQARRRTSHDMLPAMTIPEVSRVRPHVIRRASFCRDPDEVPKTRTEQAMGLVSSADPDWVMTVMRAHLKDPYLGPLLSLGEKGRDELTLQERSRLKQFSVLDGLLFYTPQQGGNPVTRLCVPVSDNNAIRLTVLLEAHDA